MLIRSCLNRVMWCPSWSWHSKMSQGWSYTHNEGLTQVMAIVMVLRSTVDGQRRRMRHRCWWSSDARHERGTAGAARRSCRCSEHTE